MYFVPYVYANHYPYYIPAPVPTYEGVSVYRNLTRVTEQNPRNSYRFPHHRLALEDHGTKPYVVNINEATKQNNTFRTAIWTGRHLQVTVMSINVGEDIGLEIHPNVDQFLRNEQGQGLVQMGKSKDNLNVEHKVYDDSAIMIPAATWHNVTNTGNVPLKLYSIYAPPHHPFGTVHTTKGESMTEEESRTNRRNEYKII